MGPLHARFALVMVVEGVSRDAAPKSSALKQLKRLDCECGRKALQRTQADVAFTPLESAHVGAVHTEQ
jgi:hypothetical protein